MGVRVKQQQRCARARAEGRLEPCGLRARVAREVEWVRTEDMVSDLYLCGFVCPRACDVQRVCRAVTARVVCGGVAASGRGRVRSAARSPALGSAADVTTCFRTINAMVLAAFRFHVSG